MTYDSQVESIAKLAVQLEAAVGKLRRRIAAHGTRAITARHVAGLHDAKRATKGATDGIRAIGHVLVALVAEGN